MARQQVTFVVNEATIKALSDLQSMFGVSNRAHVVRKAIALALVVADEADARGNVEIVKADGRRAVVMLRA